MKRNILSIYLSENFGGSFLLIEERDGTSQDFSFQKRNFSNDSCFLNLKISLDDFQDFLLEPSFLFFNGKEEEFQMDRTLISESDASSMIKTQHKLKSSFIKFDKENSQAALISEMIENVIFESNGEIIKPDVIIANSGPSSFTETRILLSAAKACKLSFPNSITFSPTMFDLVFFRGLTHFKTEGNKRQNLENEIILIMLESFRSGVYVMGYQKIYLPNEEKFSFKIFISPKFIQQKEFASFFSEHNFSYVFTKIKNEEIFENIKNIIKKNENDSADTEIILIDFSKENFSIHGINFWNKLNSLKLSENFVENLTEESFMHKNFKPFYVSPPQYKKLK